MDAGAYAVEAWVAAGGDRRGLQRDAREIKIDARRSIHDSRRGDWQRPCCLDGDDKRRVTDRHRDRPDGGRWRHLSFGTHRSHAHHRTQPGNAGHQDAYEGDMYAAGGWPSKRHSAAARLAVLHVMSAAELFPRSPVRGQGYRRDRAESTKLVAGVSKCERLFVTRGVNSCLERSRDRAKTLSNSCDIFVICARQARCYRPGPRRFSMRLGVGRLLLAIASVAVRMGGDHNTADLLAFAFLGAATLALYRTRDLRAPVRIARS